MLRDLETTTIVKEKAGEKKTVSSTTTGTIDAKVLHEALKSIFGPVKGSIVLTGNGGKIAIGPKAGSYRLKLVKQG